MVQRDERNCGSLKSNRSRSELHCDPETRLMVETRLIPFQDLHIRHVVQDNPVRRWMFSEPDISQLISLVHLQWRIFSPFFGVITSFALSLRAWTSDAPKLSSSSMSATKNVSFPDSPRV